MKTDMNTNNNAWNYAAVSRLHIECLVKDFSDSFSVRLRERQDGTIFVSCHGHGATKLAVLRYAPCPGQPGYYLPAKVTSPAPRPAAA